MILPRVTGVNRGGFLGCGASFRSILLCSGACKTGIFPLPGVVVGRTLSGPWGASGRPAPWAVSPGFVGR